MSWIRSGTELSQFLRIFLPTSFFFDDQLNLMTENKFDPLSKDKNVRLSSKSSKETNFFVLL